MRIIPVDKAYEDLKAWAKTKPKFVEGFPRARRRMTNLHLTEWWDNVKAKNLLPDEYAGSFKLFVLDEFEGNFGDTGLILNDDQYFKGTEKTELQLLQKSDVTVLESFLHVNDPGVKDGIIKCWFYAVAHMSQVHCSMRNMWFYTTPEGKKVAYLATGAMDARQNFYKEVYRHRAQVMRRGTCSMFRRADVTYHNLRRSEQIERRLKQMIEFSSAKEDLMDGLKMLQESVENSLKALESSQPSKRLLRDLEAKQSKVSNAASLILNNVYCGDTPEKTDERLRTDVTKKMPSQKRKNGS